MIHRAIALATVLALSAGCSASTTSSSSGSSGSSGGSSSGNVPPGSEAFSLTYRGTQGYASKESDLGNFIGVFVVRDEETQERVATGTIDGQVKDGPPFKDSFEFSTERVLKKGRTYEMGIALRGRTDCVIEPARRRHLYYTRILAVAADVVIEKPFENKFQPEACDVIEVKTKVPAGVYAAQFGQSTANLVVSPTGRVYRGSASLRCVSPIRAQCNGVGSGLSCTYPVEIAEDGTLDFGISGNDLDFGVKVTPEGDGFRFKGSLGGCCKENIDVLAVRTGPGAPECK